MPDAELQRHSVKVIDVSGDLVKVDHPFIVIPGFSIAWEQELYRETDYDISLTVRYNRKEETVHAFLDANRNAALFTLPDYPAQFELSAPVFHCGFQGRCAFEAPEAIWHNQIDAGEILKIQLPSDCTAHFYLGLDEVPASNGRLYELGNRLRSFRQFQDEEPLWITAEKGGRRICQYSITRILFQPRFLHEPVTVENDRLLWMIEQNYVGDVDPAFLLEINNTDQIQNRYRLSERNAELADISGLPHGQYPYRVFLQHKSVFSSSEETCLYEGVLQVGNPNELKYRGKELLLKAAQCWNFDSDKLQAVPMQPGSGAVQNIRYLGDSIASGETVPAPHFTGVLFYEDTHGYRHRFNSGRRRGYEEINRATLDDQRSHPDPALCQRRRGICGHAVRNNYE